MLDRRFCSRFAACHAEAPRRRVRNAALVFSPSVHCVAHSASLKICDLTQFYSPLSGGVKRYLHEKIAYISNCSSGDTHVLIVPGSKTEVTTNARSRVYSIRSPLVSRSSRYRALL